MPDASSFANTRLVGGYILVSVDPASEFLHDAIGRRAVARTQINGHRSQMTIVAGLDVSEGSVTLYHEILEAMTVACLRPPVAVMEMNEGDFESAARDAHQRFGFATPESLELIKLESGDRLLRLSDISTGLVLEKKIDPEQPLAKQKERLLGVFDAALAQSRLGAA